MSSYDLSIFYWMIGIQTVVSAIVASYVASKRGRSAFNWFLIGIVLVGVFSLLLLIALPPNTQALERKAMRDGTMRKCPHCAEMVKAEAKICRYCRNALTPIPPKSPYPPPTQAFAKYDRRIVEDILSGRYSKAGIVLKYQICESDFDDCCRMLQRDAALSQEVCDALIRGDLPQ